MRGDPERCDPIAALPIRRWELRTQTLHWNQLPLLMGIVNVTPDSFSDGGKWYDAKAAVARGIQLAEAGATILDIGGESTRPYSKRVDEGEELRRVIPVVQALAESAAAVISVDTTKARVAKEAVAAGAEIINDVSGLSAEAEMLDVALQTGAGVCVMHAQGTPETMQDNPHYVDVVADILAILKDRRDALLNAGLKAERICMDPGIGFGKTHSHNWELVRRIEAFHELQTPILVGHSRKGFIAKVTGDGLTERDAGTMALNFYLAQRGVGILRVHEVASTRKAFLVLEALMKGD